MATKKVNIDIIAKDKTRMAMQTATKGVTNLKNSVFNLKVAFAALGGGIVARSFVNTARDIERLQVRLKFLFGTVDEGAKAFDVMAKFASKVPFSLDEIQQGAGVLAVVSKDANELSNILEITGNVAAVTGLDFRTASEQIQRSLSAGISAADLFRERGVRDLLGFKAGATVTAKETAEAFERVFGPGGRFGKATDDLAKTFDGVLSMIGDKIFLFKKATMEAGAFDFLKSNLIAIENILHKNFGSLEKAAESFSEALVTALRKIMLGTARVLDMMKPVFDFFADSVRNLFSFINMLPPEMRAMGIIGFLMLGGKAKLVVVAIGSLFDDIKNAINVGLEKLGLDLIDFGSITESTAAMIEQFFSAEDIDVSKLRSALDTVIIGTGHMEQSMIDYLKQVDELMEQEKRADSELAKFAHLRKLRQIEAQDQLKRERDEVTMLEKAYEGFREGFKESMKAASDVTKNFEQVGKNAFKNLTDALSNFVMTGKLQIEDLARVIIKQIVNALVGAAVSAALKKATAMFKASTIKQALMDIYGAAAKAFKNFGGFPFGVVAAGASIAFGMGLVNKIRGFEKGGRPAVGQPAIVGEAGPELFIPDQAGTVVPNNQLGMGGKPVTVNFNINTVDARGFNELLVNSRGVLVNIINQAVNEKGKMAVI
tara:strand:+ start:675 stop:2645 length:1971 start_codon:yes stop_codon:yes gene_type:complete